MAFCLYCRDTNHVAASCPRMRASTKTMVRATAPPAPMPVFAGMRASTHHRVRVDALSMAHAPPAYTAAASGGAAGTGAAGAVQPMVRQRIVLANAARAVSSPRDVMSAALAAIEYVAREVSAPNIVGRQTARASNRAGAAASASHAMGAASAAAAASKAAAAAASTATAAASSAPEPAWQKLFTLRTTNADAISALFAAERQRLELDIVTLAHAALSAHVGNCQEQACIAYEYLFGASIGPLNLVSFERGDFNHVVVLIGDPSRWPDSGFVCDPWAGICVSASHYKAAMHTRMLAWDRAGTKIGNPRGADVQASQWFNQLAGAGLRIGRICYSQLMEVDGAMHP
ncbi:MAG: hypothetical protein AB7E83_21730 [Ramlibacter sp.]